MTPFVTVQFPSSPKEYGYRIDLLDVTPVIGDRVIVASKVKDDGTLGMTLATVTSEVREVFDPAGVLPIVALIRAEAIKGALDLMPKVQA